MSVDTGKVRAAVESTLKETKTLTEREVKAAVARLLKTKPGAIAATVIRDVRKAMGIDRPAAMAFARQLIRKDPTAPAKNVIEAVAARYGVRIGAPDVSRMRPEKSKRATGRRAASAGRPRRGAEKAVKAGKTPRAVKAVKAPKTEMADKASAPAVEVSPAPAPVKVRKVRGNGRRRGRGKGKAKAVPAAVEAGPVLKVVQAAAARAKAAPTVKGAVTVTFEGTGHPDDLAEFFLSLARKS